MGEVKGKEKRKGRRREEEERVPVLLAEGIKH